MKILAGDIGGTRARLALVRADAGQLHILHRHVFRSQDFPGLGPIVLAFLEQVGDDVERAGFGVACPVINNACTMPNLPWTINAADLAREIGIPRTALVNDMEAMGHGLRRLAPGDLVTLQTGEPEKHGPIALIAAGTGLGEAFLLWDGGHYRVHASEGGHAAFAPATPLQCELLAFLMQTLGHVSRERVLSGSGLVSIYEFLRERAHAPEQPDVAAEMTKNDAAAVISRHALDGTDALCVKALDLFASAYGAQAGNLALTLLASGGVYLGGGIAWRIVDKLRDGVFIAAFTAKGRLADLLTKIPVHVIVNPNVGLLGAATLIASP